jgi:plastocyanin
MKNSIGSKNRLLTGITILFTILIITGSCKKIMDNMYGTSNSPGTGSSTGPGTNAVWIQSMAFNPATITVAAGTTITWTNKDGVAHTVTSNTGLFDSGSISSSGTYSHLFASAGTFPYFCSVHPSMTATVIVN